ncbi:MAG: DUF4214 domain-containing protein [Clostridiales bacterium]|nr:DUF4214 domain-containing protein [Clostridiales bacterium]
MSTGQIRQKIKGIDPSLILNVPALVLLFASWFRGLTPVFDALPSEFDGIARLVAAFIGVLGIITNKRKGNDSLFVVIAILAASGLFLQFEMNISYVLDTALIALLAAQADLKTTSLTVFSFFSCVMGASYICAAKGFIRNYLLYGQNTYGFRSLVGLYSVISVIIISLAVTLYLWSVNKETLKYVIQFVYAVFVSALLVVAVLKALNLAAAVEAGNYQIYSRDTMLGIEVRMKGFDDYTVGLGEDEATGFDIVPDGDHYQISFDSYGVTKTLCVIDGSLFAGNYDQASSAYLWDINSVEGTPYFTVNNVETGLYITVSDDGEASLMAAPEGESDYLRIGSENNDYYETVSSSDIPQNDMRLADITVSQTASYTGSAVNPEQVTVELDGTVLQEGRDYELSYWNNYLPGTAWVDITGKGDYEGTCGRSFEIIYDDPMCDDAFYRNTSDYVVRVYRMGYLRFPSIDEVKNMVQILVGSNRTPDSVIWEIYNNNGFDCSNAQFIEAIYRLMLLRNGSRSELMNWIAELDGGATREDVIDAISVSPDYQNIWHNFGIGFR